MPSISYNEGKKENVLNMSEHIQTPQEVRAELEAIAFRLRLPLKDERVLGEWIGDGRTFSEEIYSKVLKPLYFTKRSEEKRILQTFILMCLVEFFLCGKDDIVNV